MGRVDISSRGNLRNVGHDHTLPPTPQILGTVRENVDHAPAREVDVLLDGIYSAYGLTSVTEHIRMVPP